MEGRKKAFMVDCRGTDTRSPYTFLDKVAKVAYEVWVSNYSPDELKKMVSMIESKGSMSRYLALEWVALSFTPLPDCWLNFVADSLYVVMREVMSTQSWSLTRPSWSWTGVNITLMNCKILCRQVITVALNQRPESLFLLLLVPHQDHHARGEVSRYFCNRR